MAESEVPPLQNVVEEPGEGLGLPQYMWNWWQEMASRVWLLGG